MSTTPIDYTALAKQAGAIDSQPAPSQQAGPAAAPASSVAPIDYTALAKQAGAIDSQLAPASSTTGDTGVLSKIGDWAKGTGEGAVQSMGETIQSLPWIGKKIISPEAMQAERAYFAPGTTAEKYGQTTGKVAEPILEFVLGDEALKGVALADKLGIASKIAKISQMG